MAQVDILFEGYAGDRVAGTVSLVRDGESVVVIDPGMVPDRSVILDPLSRLGVRPEAVTDVIISHHHPDHTMNIALFPHIRVHDHWATYEGDNWTTRPAEGVEISPHIALMETPGHTPQDITTVVRSEDEVYAFTHLWWNSASPNDPRATLPELLQPNRDRVLEVASVIVPGHGAPFAAESALRVADG
ncbi:MAG: MBL fold metallo-hydrolase [Acidimicrobiia bacterium]|nr:MBL fold metallo-hydrolase [Acidimicrobiia bacterium]